MPGFRQMVVLPSSSKRRVIITSFIVLFVLGGVSTLFFVFSGARENVPQNIQSERDVFNGESEISSRNEPGEPGLEAKREQEKRKKQKAKQEMDKKKKKEQEQEQKKEQEKDKKKKKEEDSLLVDGEESEEDQATHEKEYFWNPPGSSLYQYLNDPTKAVKDLQDMIIIRDAYPRAKHHYLCIPKLRILSWQYLKEEHVALLEKMKEEAYNFVAQRHPNVEFKFGFHAQTSQKQLHLHMVSIDFEHITSQRVWNTFNTEFFISIEEVLKVLKGKRRIFLTSKNFSKFESLHHNKLSCPFCQKKFEDDFTKHKTHYSQNCEKKACAPAKTI